MVVNYETPKKPINRRSFQRERVRKNHLKSPEKSPENYPEEFSAQRSSPAMKKLCCKHYKVVEVPWGATPPRFPLFFYPTWHRCGFSARLPRFLLDIGHSLDLYPLKIWGPSQAKWTKASSVLIWRTMAESIHDSRPSIWTSPHNLLRSQIPLSSSSIVFCIFLKRQKRSQFLSFIIDEICNIAFHGNIAFYGTKPPFTAN